MNEIKELGVGLREYRTEIPNMILELGLTVYELALYVHLKRTAGDSGGSWKSTQTLAKETGMSSGSIVKAKRGLVARELIKLEKTPHETGTDQIAIVPVWEKNFLYFTIERSPGERGHSPHERERSPRELKNKPFKNKPIKNVKGNKKNNSNNIITKSLKKKILAMGWTGSLEEIIKMYNEDPDFVKAWVEIIDKVDLYPRAGLLRKSLRSGEKPPTEADKRNRYLEDPLAEFIEN